MSFISGGSASVYKNRSAVPAGTLNMSTASADPTATSNIEIDIDVRVVMIDDSHDRRQLMSYVVEQGEDVTWSVTRTAQSAPWKRSAY